jgi:hypothetical protein
VHHDTTAAGRQVLPPASVLLLSNSTQKSPQRKYGGIFIVRRALDGIPAYLL